MLSAEGGATLASLGRTVGARSLRCGVLGHAERWPGRKYEKKNSLGLGTAVAKQDTARVGRKRRGCEQGRLRSVGMKRQRRGCVCLFRRLWCCSWAPAVRDGGGKWAVVSEEISPWERGGGLGLPRNSVAASTHSIYTAENYIICSFPLTATSASSNTAVSSAFSANWTHAVRRNPSGVGLSRLATDMTNPSRAWHLPGFGAARRRELNSGTNL